MPTKHAPVSLREWNLYGRDTAANQRKPLAAGVESDAIILVGPIVGAVTETTGRRVSRPKISISPQGRAFRLPLGRKAHVSVSESEREREKKREKERDGRQTHAVPCPPYGAICCKRRHLCN